MVLKVHSGFVGNLPCEVPICFKATGHRFMKRFGWPETCQASSKHHKPELINRFHLEEERQVFFFKEEGGRLSEKRGNGVDAL